MKRGGPAGQGPARGPDAVPDATRGPDPQAAQTDAGQQAAVPLRMGEEVCVGQAGTEEHRRNHHGEEHRCDRAPGPGGDGAGDVGQEGCSRFAGPLLHDRRSAQTLGRNMTAHGVHRRDGGDSGDDTDGHGPLAVLASQPSGEDDGGQPVGADDVAGEEHGMGRAEEDHPQAPAPHEATGVDGGLLTGPGLLLLRRLTPGLHTGEGLEIGPGTRGDAPVDHGGQPEAEQHREQRIGPVVDQEGTRP